MILALVILAVVALVIQVPQTHAFVLVATAAHGGCPRGSITPPRVMLPSVLLSSRSALRPLRPRAPSVFGLTGDSGLLRGSGLTGGCRLRGQSEV